MKTVKKRNYNPLNPFLKGFGSVFNISGPNPNEYRVLFESDYKKALQTNWEKVGQEIKSSIDIFHSEIVAK